MFTLDPSKSLLGWLCRHGALEEPSVWDGWGPYELSEEGMQQAEAAARWLSFERIGRAVSSDVPRTNSTAQYLMNTGCVECPYLATDPNLRPWMVAGFTGKEKTPERLAQFKKYLDNPDLVIPDGESLNQLNARVQVVYQYLCAPYERLPTAIFTHNSVIKSLMNLNDVKSAVNPGGIVAVYLGEKGDISFEVKLGAVEKIETGVS
jgi:broad specificity phosphatase PhoE